MCGFAVYHKISEGCSLEMITWKIPAEELYLTYEPTSNSSLSLFPQMSFAKMKVCTACRYLQWAN